MRLTIIALVLVFLASGVAYGQITGDLVSPSTEVIATDYVPMPNVTYDQSRSYTIIEDAKIENTGFERIFISLPKGWTFDTQILSARGESIITNKRKLYDKYGNPGNAHSFINNYFVFWSRAGYAQSRGDPTTVYWDDGSQSYGWYIRPNERLIFTIKMTPSNQEAIIDPFKLEQNRSDIRLLEWNQEFYVYPQDFLGFMTAPWIVKGATMVEAYPGPYSNISAFGGKLYYDLFELESQETESKEEKLDVPSWDEWFAPSSGLFSLEPVSLAALTIESIEIPEIEDGQAKDEEQVFIPVWYRDAQMDFIRYRYEWELGKIIDGVDVHLFTKRPATATEMYGGGSSVPSSALTVKAPTTVPEWYEWF